MEGSHKFLSNLILKVFFPPFVGFLSAVLVDQLLDVLFKITPADDRGTPGLVYLIELLFILISSIFIYSLQAFIVFKLVNNKKQNIFLKLILWGEFAIVLICFLDYQFTLNNLEYGVSKRLVSLLYSFLCLNTFWNINIFVLNRVNLVELRRGTL